MTCRNSIWCWSDRNLALQGVDELHNTVFKVTAIIRLIMVFVLRLSRRQWPLTGILPALPLWPTVR
jgi:hypothetical protein